MEMNFLSVSFSLYEKELNFIWIILTVLLTKKEFFTIPYVKFVSEKFSPIIMFCKLTYSILNSLFENEMKNFIKKEKDNLNLLCKNLVSKCSL